MHSSDPTPNEGWLDIEGMAGLSDDPEAKANKALASRRLSRGKPILKKKYKSGHSIKPTRQGRT